MTALPLLPWARPRIERGVELRGNMIRSHFGTTAKEPQARLSASAAGVLQGFVRLAGASERQVAVFVRRYGPLNLNETGDPLGRLDPWSTIQPVDEPIEAYLFLARVCRAALAVANTPLLSRSSLSDAQQAERRAFQGTRFVTREDARPIYELIARRRGKPDGRTLMTSSAANRTGDGAVLAAAVVNWWLAVGDVRPALHIEERARVRGGAIRYGATGGLWGAIGLELLAAVQGQSDTVLCDVCGQPSLRRRLRRRKQGQHSYCGRPECERVRWRIAKSALA